MMMVTVAYKIIDNDNDDDLEKDDDGDGGSQNY